MALQEKLEEHPDYPSMLSISDILKEYGVDNISIKCSPEKLTSLPLPLLTHIKVEDRNTFSYAIVRSIKYDIVQYYDVAKKKWVLRDFTGFIKIWPGTVLLTDKDEHAGEKEYLQNKTKEYKKNISIIAGILFLPIVSFVTAAFAFISKGSLAIYPVLYMLLALGGAAVTSLLLWHEVDRHNPLLRQICTGGKKVNCNAILQSGASTIMGMSWSRIGCSYFTGTLLIILFTGITEPQILGILAWLSTISSLYILFSLYYQWRIAKQWCVLCLYVQAILAVQCFIALFAGWYAFLHIKDITLQHITIGIFSFAVPFLLSGILIPAFKKAKEGKHHRTEASRLKHNIQIFNALLTKQKAIEEDPSGIGLVLGNPGAKYRLIKVCNPYCGPCAKAHPVIDELLRNNDDLQVRIIFTATNEENDIKAPPVKHILAIAESGDERLLMKALDDWYLPEKKEYDAFAAKYPMNRELNRQVPKLEQMKEWCDKAAVSFTPTFFIAREVEKDEDSKYYQLPEIYSVKDLKYFLSV
jgi:uncharacterized membrane protein